MDPHELRAALLDLPLGGLRYYPSIGSTNDAALAWSQEGAPDLALVVADEQTAGRGRAGRKWLTPPASALAFSLILRPTAAERAQPARLTGLAALAVVEACAQRGLQPQIKWPNDILLNGKKAAGILVESVWSGAALEACIVGVGVNVLAASVPPGGQVLFPAGSLEGALGHAVSRVELLHDILLGLRAWRARLGGPEFLRAWQGRLAFRGEQVQLLGGAEAPLTGELLGLDEDGSLRIRKADGHVQLVQFGEIQLRPVV